MPGSCGKADLGTLVLPLFGAAEEGWPPPVRAALYLLGLLWFFLGVGIIADIFMTAIEVITSKELAVKLHAKRPDAYKDDNHKPEMAIAVSRFEALCSFQKVDAHALFTLAQSPNYTRVRIF